MTEKSRGSSSKASATGSTSPEYGKSSSRGLTHMVTARLSGTQR